MKFDIYEYVRLAYFRSGQIRRSPKIKTLENRVYTPSRPVHPNMDASDSRGDVRRQISSISHLDNNGAGMSIKKLFHDSKEEDERGRESGGEEGTCPLGRSNNAREISGDMADLSWRRIVVT